MITPRIIPCLLLRKTGLVKGVQFRNHKYIGDPLNAVKIFSEKEVDELIFLDITATREGRITSVDFVQEIADECYMPFCIGGGIREIDQAKRLFQAGAEKVVLNTHALENPELIESIAGAFGSQSVVVAMDVKKIWTGQYRVYSHNATQKMNWDPVQWALRAEKMGAGEIFLNTVNREGTMKGYDLKLIRTVAESVNIPVIASGGAGELMDIYKVIHTGKASAAAAGSLFVFYKSRDAILINFPNRKEVADLWESGKA